MNAELLATGRLKSMEPLTCLHNLGECLIGHQPLLALQCDRLERAGLSLVADQPEGLFIRGDAWLCEEDLLPLPGREGSWVLQDAKGNRLAWSGPRDYPVEGLPIVRAHPESFPIRHPWDLLRLHQQTLASLQTPRIAGFVHPGAWIMGLLRLDTGSVILPGVCIEGPVVIGEDCQIGPNCYIRGPVSIGDRCHIGQAVELKNAIIMNNSHVGHLSYCGDSILGENVNFGAGTICANFRHDGLHHRSMVDGVLIDTGLRKLGVICGDNVHTGINTSLYPGRKLWPNQSTRPGEIVQRDLKPD